MNDLFVIGLWRVDAKYNFESYIRMLPLVLRRIHQEAIQSDRKIKVVIATEKEGIKRAKINDPAEFVEIGLNDLPPVPSVSEPCGLKLGWMLSSEKMNGLNQVWANKIFLMDEISRRFGDSESNVVWCDAGLKQFNKNFPIEYFKKFDQIQPGKVYSNRYENFDRVKHCRCNIPHHIRAGVIACHRDFVHDFSRLFSKHMGRVSENCGSWDEETILSSIHIDNPGLFKTWQEL
jgi:hypothetical protein